MEQILQQLQFHVFDEKFFSARGASWLSRTTGVSSCFLGQALAILLALYLEFGGWAFFVANGLLIVYPCLSTYVFPEERPTRDLLLVYWSCFGALSAFDRFLEQVPLYYVSKVVLMALFFLEPYCFAAKINKLIEWKLEELNMLTSSELRMICRRTGRSPLPTKPVDFDPPLEEKKSETYGNSPGLQLRDSVNTAVDTAQLIPEPIVKDESLKTARLPPEDPTQRSAVLVGNQMKSARLLVPEPPPICPAVEEKPKNSDARSEYARTPAESLTTAMMTGGRTDGLHLPQFEGTNPMAVDSSYRLQSEGPGIDNKDIGPANNIHDLLLWPQEVLTFNAPFDYENLTYHMTLKNNSKHRMAFAIKGNCIPRVTACPPHGLVAPGQKMVIAVMLRRFNYSEVADLQKDRICFEYVLLKKSEDEKTQQFSHKLLQKSDWRRRKNIKIAYNV